MYQRIDETIAVIGVYRPAQRPKFQPKKFQWQDKTLVIQEVTLANDVKDGGVRKRYYSVVVGENAYRLSFNRETEIWTLEEIWYEG